MIAFYLSCFLANISFIMHFPSISATSNFLLKYILFSKYEYIDDLKNSLTSNFIKIIQNFDQNSLNICNIFPIEFITMNKDDFELFLKFGDNSGQQAILNLQMSFSVNKEKVKEVKQSISIKEEKENDLYLVIEFLVVKGREKEAIDYLQKGMDEPDQNEYKWLNPLQRFLHRPKSSGKVIFQEKPGIVIVNYILYQQFTSDNFHEGANALLNEMEKKKYDPLLNLNFLIKGRQNTFNEQKVVIDPNYVELKTKVHSLQADLIFSVLQESQIIDEEISKNPVAKMLFSGCRKAEINFSFSYFRKISDMYSQAGKIQRKVQPTPYICKNLLKNEIRLNLIVKNQIHGKAKVNFKNETDLQRLLEIYEKISKKVIDQF